MNRAEGAQATKGVDKVALGGELHETCNYLRCENITGAFNCFVLFSMNALQEPLVGS